MTTDHVALAIMHGTTPQQEAQESPSAGRLKKKTSFVDVKTIEERRKEKMETVKKILPKQLGDYRVVGIAEVKDSKKASRVYLRLVDKNGEEPIKEIVENEVNLKKYDGALTALEEEHGLTSGTPKITLCLRSVYWTKAGKAATVGKAAAAK
jgi:hypothetical protein